MINQIHSMFHRPEKGWDPISAEYAFEYADREWERIDLELVDRLSALNGGLNGKRILDLGGGPGHYSATFAERGAKVVWHDVSKTYLNIARSKSESKGLEIEYSLGYLEEAHKFIDTPFDIVFNRICWCYSMNDVKFASLIHSLTKPGGFAYIQTHNEKFPKLNLKQKLLSAANKYFYIKVGHPYPPRGRIATLLGKHSFREMNISYEIDSVDTVYLKK